MRMLSIFKIIYSNQTHFHSPWHVENPLCHHKSHPEEQVTGRDEGKHQKQHSHQHLSAFVSLKGGKDRRGGRQTDSHSQQTTPILHFFNKIKSKGSEGSCFQRHGCIMNDCRCHLDAANTHAHINTHPHSDKCTYVRQP